MNRSRDRLEALAAGEGTEDLLGDNVTGTRDQSDRNVRDSKTRVRGVFSGTNKKLDVLTEIPGYQMRIFNDTPGRLERAQTGGWEFVKSNEVALAESNKVLTANSAMDDKVRYIVGTTDQNEPLYAFLMKIRKEWFEEDQSDAAAKIRATEQEMVKNGGLNTDRIGERYLPDQRRQALTMRKDTFERGGGVS